ncbi:MAG: mucoidy inhibitor MuiA family protein, partial [Bacteroidetes bacterium]|nr:mucoidy inhibitor MuiA family protein [Bacteroidota bacterium]
MKNIKFFFIVILLFSVLKYGFCETIPVKSNITQVTVFLSGAQVTHSASVTLPAGNSDLVFEDLPQNIDQNSIQVKGGGNFTILSVSQQINFLKDRLKPANIILMEDSLKALQERIDLETNFQHILTEEESLLYTNKSIGNKDIGVDALDLEEMANFFRKRLTDIRNKIIESKLKVTKYSELTAKLNNQLAELNVRHNKPTTEIIISVSSKTKIQAKIQAGYLVYNCGWTPVYDIRTVSSESKKISLVYKANIYQNSGLDWNNVNLTLSTGNPVQSGIRPELRPWILQFRQPVVYYEGAKEKAAYRKAEIPQAAQAFESDISKNDDFNTIQAQTASSYTQATESRVATEFSIGVPYTVPSDGKPHLAEIQNYNVQAQFRYYTAPKIDKDAFLLARIIGWEELNLLPGEANIFNE